MEDDPRDDPAYRELVEQVNSRTCVAFVGSGLSIGHYPSWPDLIGDLCEACGLPETAAEARRGAEPDRLTTWADEAHDHNPDTYYAKLDEIFGQRPTSTRLAYSLLLRLRFASYVTTNFDPLLEVESRKDEHEIRGIRALPSLNAGELNGRRIFYVHGYLREGRSATHHSLVLRRSEFDHAYDGDRSMLPGFLQQLLVYHPVLFIGAGLQEPQLEHVFDICRRLRRGIESEYSARAPKRYILRPTTLRTSGAASDAPLMRDKRAEAEEDRRFEEIDVKVVRYHKGGAGHSGIEEMLEEWCELSPLPIEPGFPEGGTR